MVLWWLVGALTAGFIGWTVVSASRVLHPRPKPVVAYTPLLTPYAHPIRASAQRPFDLWLVESKTPRGVILVCHGYYATHQQVLPVADGLARRGYTAALFDFSAHGSRRMHGERVTFGQMETADLTAVAQWLRTHPSTAHLPMGGVGWSFGGAMLCRFAAAHPELRALVVDSTYTRFFPVLARAIRRQYGLPQMPWAWLTRTGVQLALGQQLSESDPLTHAASCRQPLLVIQGDRDETIGPGHDAELAAAWHGPVERWALPAIGHVAAYTNSPDAYGDRLAAFFDQWLATASPASA